MHSNGPKKTWMIIASTLLIVLIHISVQVASASESTSQLKEKIEMLEKSSEALKELHTQLQINKDDIFALYDRAVTNMQNNILKVYMKGGLDIYNKVTAPLGAATDLVLEAFLNLTVEPMLWTVQEDRVVLLSLSKRAAQRNTKLLQFYNALSEVMKWDISRFDDDQPPLTFTKAFWGVPDEQTDSDQERATRKLKIIIKLSDRIYKATEAEMARVRDERRKILDLLSRLKGQYQGQSAWEEKLRKEMAAWEKARKERREKYPPASRDDDRDRGHSEYGRDFHAPAASLSGESTKERLSRLKREREEKEKALKAMMEREKTATLYIDSESSREYVEGDQGFFLARIDPPDVCGSFVWRIDDRVVRSAKMRSTDHLTYKFHKEGIYDLSVTLNIRGKYQDRYVDQVRIKPSPKAPAYPPEMEGKKTSALNLPSCKYSVLYKGGHIVLTGHYFTPFKQRVEYTSLPLRNFNPAYPTAGMFALRNGTGYHVYQTVSDEDEADKGLFIVTRMKGVEVKILHRLKVHGRFQMRPALDIN